MMIICVAISPFLAISHAQAESTENPKWHQWLKENAQPIESIRPAVGDVYRDLRFFDPLLKNKRIIFLGESSHGAAQFNSSKVRLVKYLHEKLGYQVLAFESGLGELFALNTQIYKQSPTESMKNSLFEIWQTKEILPLFEYIKKSKTTNNPLQTAGIDMQPVGSYGIFLKEWFQNINPQMGNLAKRTEDKFTASLYHSDIKSFQQEQKQMIYAYQKLYQFTKENEKELAKIHPDSNQLMKVTQYVLQDRIHSITNVIPHYVTYNYYFQEGNKSLSNEAYDQYNIARDQAMAKHMVWITEKLYPKQKIIVWAHNLHIRKANTKTENPNRSSVINLGELLLPKIKKQSYILGLYMNRGISALNDRKPIAVRFPHPTGRMESILSKTGYPNFFVDLSQAKKHEGTSWMFSKRAILDWGAWEEQVVFKQQYDGILYIDQVNIPQYVDKASIGRTVPYFSNVSIPKK
ncbi:erythromycin esterase family protein [Shimazuella kribbensis]|uniref:erythromycin esterase family protein n=1 Tax=Shimazuella kribbensis TaxID=139808 RepID=UPI00041057E8|nr:erythromycin esterase family protein [Shimazuella kribbensis]